MRGRTADLQRLFHIVKWCRKLEAAGAVVQTCEQFVARKNHHWVDVSAFYIGQIGEHVRNLSDEMKAELSDIPWREINGMRNKLIHNYDEVRTDLVWQVITEGAPALAERCLEVLRAENKNVDAELREELAEETDIFDGEDAK